MIETGTHIRLVNVTLPGTATLLKSLFVENKPKPRSELLELHINSTSSYTITDMITSATIVIAANTHKVIPARNCFDNIAVSGSGTLALELYYDD